MATVRYIWHGFIHRGKTFIYVQYSHPPYLSPFAKCLEGVVLKSAMFCIDSFIGRISSSMCGTGLSQWYFHFGEEFVIAWTPEKTTTLGGTEPHHSSWQCKESHHRCHGPLAPLEMENSGTSTVLTRYEFMRLSSLHQSERATARDPVQHKRWTYPCYRAVNTEHQQRWTRWWFMTPSKHLEKGYK